MPVLSPQVYNDWTHCIERFVKSRAYECIWLKMLCERGLAAESAAERLLDLVEP